VAARLAADVGELVADLVDRLVPGHARPLAARELHRVAQAALAMHELAHRGALGAMRAAVDRRVPARLLADPDALGDFSRHRAADRAVRAHALADRHLGARHRPRTRLGLAHPGERHRAAPRAAAGPKAASPREAAPTMAPAR